MARRAALSLPRIAAALIGTALLGAVAVAMLPLPGPAASPSPAPQITKSGPVPPADPGLYPIRSALKIEQRLQHGDWRWDESKAPLGKADAALLVTIDLKAQMMSVFRGGHEIGVAVIAHGATDKPTPTGVFPIMTKTADRRSNTYVDDAGRRAPMPWAQQLTTSGIFIHGAKVRREWGTNGCIGVPNEFAEKLFAATRVGDRVIVTDGAVMQVGNSIPTA